jgi:hypothetical protein
MERGLKRMSYTTSAFLGFFLQFCDVAKLAFLSIAKFG